MKYSQYADLGADLRYVLEAVISGRVQYPGRKKDYSRSIAVSGISSGENELTLYLTRWVYDDTPPVLTKHDL